MSEGRYARQLRLPGFGLEAQAKLARAKVLMIGAGGLGSSALPMLAGAGVGHTTILDHDRVDLSNLHRQTLYKESDIGQNKAECAALALKDLNGECEVEPINARFETVMDRLPAFDLVLDGTDNFKAKTAINAWAVRTATPLLSASVLQFGGQLGLFAGHEDGAPCYRCLFPDLPGAAPDCATAGVLGTMPGILGQWQAHIALLYLAGVEADTIRPGLFITLDGLGVRMQKLHVPKLQGCSFCGEGRSKKAPDITATIPPLLALDELPEHTIVIDVREAEELELDPIPGALHIPLMQIPQRLNELPENKPLAFVCAGNIRSRHAADYLAARGYENVIVLDKFSL